MSKRKSVNYLLGLLLSVVAHALEADTLGSRDVLDKMAGNILRCPTYDFGPKHPIEPHCLGAVVDSTLLAIQLTPNPKAFADFALAIKNILNCPVYSYDGVIQPFEEWCVYSGVQLAKDIATRVADVP